MTPKKNKKRVFVWMGWIIFFIFSFLVIAAFFLEKWLFNTWAELTADEILFHLKSSISGTNPTMIIQAVLKYGIPLLLCFLALITIVFLLRKKRRVRSLFVLVILLVEFGVLYLLKYDMDRRINFTSYVIRNIRGDNSTFIEDNYIDPKSIELSFPDKKRNLIYIYLESMEMTFSDKESGGAFEKNVIPELTKLAYNNEDFSGNSKQLNGGISLPGSNWTMGAMFAQSTGLPLKLSVGSNDMQDQDSFFPDISSLGDILEKEGYQQELLLGSNAKFGGRKLFFQGHGNFQINDYNYALKHNRISDGYKVFWGYEDEKLFEFAKEDLLRMSKESQPFNLTLLTVDTHFEDGYLCDLCQDDFGEQYANVMACSSRQVSAFVNWIQEQSFYKDTTIVISGDHPTMDKDFCTDVSSEYQRKVFVSIINPASNPDSPDLQREYSTFDLFPTTLAAMGVSIPGNQLGLGVNLFSNKNTIIENFGLEKCESELDLPSQFMDKLSKVTITTDKLDNIREKIKIVSKGNKDGSITLSLRGLHRYLNKSTISSLELELEDKDTGEKTTSLLNQNFPDVNRPIIYYYDIDLDLKGKNLEDYDGNYYIYIDDVCDHYKIADFNNNLVDSDK